MISIFYCEHFGTEQFSFNNKRPPAELRIKDIRPQSTVWIWTLDLLHKRARTKW